MMKTNNKRNNKTSSWNGLCFGFGLICGLVISTVLYYYQWIPASFTKATAVSKQVATTQKTLKMKAQTPHFDFYNMLEEKENPLEVTASSKTVNNKSYVIQAAAFANYKEADRLKAQLTLEGYKVQIKTVTQNQATLYRLFLGPYNNKERAQADQERLKNKHINSLLLTS